MNVFQSKHRGLYFLMGVTFLVVFGAILMATVRLSPEVEEGVEHIDTTNETIEVVTTTANLASREKMQALNEEITLAIETAPEPIYRAEIIETEPMWYEMHPGDASLIVYHSLSIVDRANQEVVSVGLHDLAAEALLDDVRSVPVHVQYYLGAQILGWDTKDEEVLWGMIELYASADPPLAHMISLFALDVSSPEEIQTFALPERAPFGKTIFNTASKSLLYETIDFSENLSLRVFDVEGDSVATVVTYPQKEFKQYCSWDRAYVYDTTDFYGTCGMEHGLQPRWVTDTEVAYLDFHTREEIRVLLSTEMLMPSQRPPLQIEGGEPSDN